MTTTIYAERTLTPDELPGLAGTRWAGSDVRVRYRGFAKNPVVRLERDTRGGVTRIRSCAVLDRGRGDGTVRLTAGASRKKKALWSERMVPPVVAAATMTVVGAFLMLDGR